MPLSYYNPYASQIADIIGNAGKIQAQALETGANAKANAVTGIANTGLKVLGDFVKYKHDEPLRQLELMKVKQAQDEMADNNLIKQTLMNTGGDPTTALSQLRTLGPRGLTAAGKLQTQISADAKEKLDEQSKHLTIAKQQLDLSGPLLQSVIDAPDEQKAATYQDVLPQLRKYVGPDLGAKLPDEYDPDVVKRAWTWGTSATEMLAQRRLALESGTKALEAGRSIREIDTYTTKALAQWLPTVTDQAGWDEAMKFAKTAGATPEMLARFGNTYTPEAAKHAEIFGMTQAERDKQTPVLGSFESYLDAYARDVVHKKPEELSATDQERAKMKWTMAGHIPTKDGGMTAVERKTLVDGVIANPALWGNLTETKRSDIATDLVAKGFTQFGVKDVAQKAVAERWRITELDKIDNQPYDAQGRELTPEQIANKKAEIQKSYLLQTGQEAPVQAPVAKPVVPPAVAPPAAPVAGTPTPAATAQPAILAGVTKALAGKPATNASGAVAIYLLKDKSSGTVTKWKITPDGPVQVQ